jgi:hypothetical protein
VTTLILSQLEDEKLHKYAARIHLINHTGLFTIKSSVSLKTHLNSISIELIRHHHVTIILITVECIKIANPKIQFSYAGNEVA